MDETTYSSYSNEEIANVEDILDQIDEAVEGVDPSVAAKVKTLTKAAKTKLKRPIGSGTLGPEPNPGSAGGDNGDDDGNTKVDDNGNTTAGTENP